MRTKILNMLKNQGDCLSGEKISRELSVSRTAIWKHINALKKEGYKIEASPRRGYRLSWAPDLLIPKEISGKLDTKIFGHEIHHFSSIDTTNNEAKKIAELGCSEGTVVLAEAQYIGKGRMSRGWFSPKEKGIWMSIILKPPFSPFDAPKCTLLAAVAIVKAIKRVVNVKCDIKWPNDILYHGKKLVGILAEMSAEIERIGYIVIGMGINVNIDQNEFPPELQEIATSLLTVTGHSVSRLELLCAILSELEESYYRAIEEGFSPILDEWRQLSSTLGQNVNVIGAKLTFNGKALDIDDDGALLVETVNGIQRVIAGDVSIRPSKT